MYLLQHGLTHDCSPSRGVFAVSWAYPQPHTLGYSSMTSSTATGVLRCAFSSMDLPLGLNPFRGPAAAAQGHRCCEMHLLWHGLIQGHRCLKGVQLPHGLTHRSQALPLEFTLEFQPVQNSSTAAVALAICQPDTSPWLLSKCSQAPQSKVISSTVVQ